MKKLALALAVVLGWPVLAAVPAAADDGVIVTWPSATRVNPDNVDYDLQVEDSVGTGYLVARWGSYGSKVEVAHSGTTTMDFGLDGFGVVQVHRCTGLPFTGCGAPIATSPYLEVRTSQQIVLELDRPSWPDLPTYGPGEVMTATATLYPFDAPTTVDWRIVRPEAPDTAVVSGQHAFATGSESFTPSLAGLTSGHYRLVVDAEQETTDFGHLEGSNYVDFDVDVDFSLQASAVGEAIVFPAKDYYKNFTGLRLISDESIEGAWLTVRKPDGTAVGARRPVELDYTGNGYVYKVTWDGKVDSKPLPEADYRLLIEAEDLHGNLDSVQTGIIRVDDDQFRNVVIDKKLKPTTVLVDTAVGACSTLSRPATGGWSGSFGFLSQTKCRRPGDSDVVTVSGFRLPTLTGLHASGFLQVKLSLEGGPAKGPRARTTYINGGLYSANGKRIPDVRSIVGPYGINLVQADYARYYVNTKGDHPMLYWFTGLTAGSRYDVRRYLLRVTYVDLVDPDKVKNSHPADRSITVQPPDPVGQSWVSTYHQPNHANPPSHRTAETA